MHSYLKGKKTITLTHFNVSYKHKRRKVLLWNGWMGMPVMLACLSACKYSWAREDAWLLSCGPANKNVPSLNSLDRCNSKHPGVCSCAYVHMHVCMWAEARGRHWMSSSIILHNSLTQGCSLKSEFINLARTTRQQIPLISLSPSPSTRQWQAYHFTCVFLHEC